MEKVLQRSVMARTQFSFREGEEIWMEISRKYSLDEVNLLAGRCGFETVTNFTDTKGWFVDAMWRAR